MNVETKISIHQIVDVLEKEGLLVVEMDEQHTMLLKIC